MAVQQATLGGGCFWCLDSVYRRVKGVSQSLCGYTAGDTPEPNYKAICTGTTGHAEVVQLSFDDEVISFSELLKILFSIHDPTTLNRQGNDIGTQYRSIILAHNETQHLEAEAFIQQLSSAGQYDKPIVTQVEMLEVFHEAEDYHQDYFSHNPHNGYCQAMIPPKLIKVADYFDK